MNKSITFGGISEADVLVQSVWSFDVLCGAAIMTMHAVRLERSMEERVTRLESHVDHIQADVSEMKADIRRLDQKIDQLDDKVDARFDSLKDSISELRLSTERSFHRMDSKIDTAFHKLARWGLTLYLALASSLLGVMAKGFGWIQ